MGVSYTEEQRACIDSLIGPVDVSAGAGSGKTFTLTQRIAKALADPTSGVDDIDQICAITFTEKAAAELKGRVRSTLRAQGMFDQALKVDAAWISTIHGMCSRILRAHALDLGIDPAFSILGEGDAARLFDESLDEALQADRQGPRRFDALTQRIDVRTNGFGDSISNMVKQLLDASLGQEEGPRSLVRSQDECPGSGALARRLLMAYEELSQVLAAQKEGTQRNKALEVTEQAVQALEGFLSEGEASQEAFLRTLDSCKFVPKTVPKGAKPALEEYRDIHYEVIRQFVMGLSGQLADQLIDLACDVDRLLAEKKRVSGSLDNNDLLVQAMRAMEVPSVAADYCQRFRLVMVDEFQDTDQIQLSIVRALAGPGMRYLCTVGDAQQSIYGFRGADIQVYRAYQESLEDLQLKQQGAQPKQLLLSKNFRSHQDVLAFVRHVCQQPRVFGEKFLDLEPTYDGNKYKAEYPRIQVRVSATQEKGDYSSIACARALQANQIAGYFKQMRDAGHDLSEMVLLLGSTTQAGLYAQAIRDQVGPCVIAGGSLFASSQEAQLVGSLLRAIANPQDTHTLFQVLSSQMFALSAGDFLRLASVWDAQLGDEAPCGLDVGIESAMRGFQGSLTQEASHAVGVFAKAWQALGRVPVAKIAMQVVQDSGWLLRLEGEGAEGLSQAGNVLKAIRLADRLEQESCLGPASLAMRFNAELDVVREAPGALNVGGQEAVRIMTIHASKGLEFPIVALADFDRTFTAPSLVTRKVDGIPCMSLRASLGKIAGQDQVKTAFEDYDPDGLTGSLENLPADAFYARLAQEAQLAEREERQRLFYVGATRAKEALCVFLALKSSSKSGLGTEESIAGDVRYALFGGEGFPHEPCEVDYGGTQPLRYAIAFAGPQEKVGEIGQGFDQGESFAIPEVHPFKWDGAQLAPKAQTGLFSYSSFSRVLHEAEDQILEKQPVGFDFDEESLVEKPSVADKDKATDFGSALHRLCQIAALRGFDVARSKVEAMQATYGVKDAQRLSGALENWLSSEECARAYSFERVQPELPFNIAVGSLVMEGEIDLICTNPEDKSRALVIDYKTGGYPSETQEQLQEKHGLQARCYAYAVLMQGYESVELVFYRVEQGNSVSFTFTQADIPQLLDQLLPACDLLG